MVYRTKPRTTLSETRSRVRVGFRTQTEFPAEAFLEARYRITLTNGESGTEYGYTTNVPSQYSKQMFEDARLHAVSKFLYRRGYFVDKSNYQELDMERVKDVKLLSYSYYYTENQFQSFSTFTQRGRRVMVERDSKGRFIKRKTGARVGKSVVEEDLPFKKKKLRQKVGKK